MPKFESGMEAMLDTFVFETGGLLEKLDEILMRTEQEDISEVSDDDIGEIFRVMHTIKGSSSMMGLQNMSHLAHAAEDLFDIIRQRAYKQMDSPKLYELLFRASDSLKEELEGLEDEDKPLTDFSDQIENIGEFGKFLTSGGEEAAEDSAGQSSGPQGLFDEDEPEGLLTYRVEYAESCAMPSARAMVLLRKLETFGEITKTIPADLDDDSSDAEIKAHGLYIKIMTDDRDTVERLLRSALNVESAKLVTGESSAAAADGSITYRISYSPACAMPSARAMVLLRKLEALCEVVGTVPEDLESDSADDVIRGSGLVVRIKTDDPDRAEKLMKTAINVADGKVEGAPAPKKEAAAPKQEAAAPEKAEEKQEAQTPAAQTPKAPAKAPAKSGEKHEQSMLTVKLEKLDKLLDLVSELVITESAVTSSPDLRGFEGSLERFNKSSRELKKLTDELQDVVMAIRMVPVSTAFQKMNRVVRDMNNKLKKNVTLVFEGEDTEVDKAIIDILGDPLMHIVRNAVDHGIESPAEREAAGKTEKATVTLKAGYDSSEVVISCTDNGAGMDASKIMAKAKSRGLLTKPENEYTEKEILSFVMAAGFSTNESVTEYSGRGVGMDVVKRNIEKVGGRLQVSSTLGQGTTFTIRIPLSMSIIDVLTLTVGGLSLSLPSAAVREAFSAQKKSFIRDPDGNEFVYLRDKCLPLVRLSDALELEGAVSDITEGICIYCREGRREAVLFADRIECDQQVVVKPFSPLLEHLKLKENGLAGCSILGDGSITLILDVREIITGKEEKRNGGDQGAV